MIHHETKWNPLSANDSMHIPTAAIQIAEAQCFHCGRVTRFPVPPEYVDWKRIAEEYRGQYEKMMNRFNQIIIDIDVMQSGSNPVREYLDNEWKVILDEGRKWFRESHDATTDFGHPTP